MSKTTSDMGRNGEADADAAHWIEVYDKGRGADCNNTTGICRRITKVITRKMWERRERAGG